jgi:GNAT superfamily N-acetyltransferase
MSQDDHPDSPPDATPAPTSYGVRMIRDHLDNFPNWEFREGFGMRPIQPGEEHVWEDIQRDADPSFPRKDGLFDQEFGYDSVTAWKRVFLVTGPEGLAVGTIGAWYDRNFLGEEYGRIHWVATRPSFQGLGLAKASLIQALRVLAQFHHKVYLSTQTKRVPAIAIYLDAGFFPQIASEPDRIAWSQAMPAMRKPEHRALITEAVAAKL